MADTDAPATAIDELPMPPAVTPVLGVEVQATDVCSKCRGPIPEEHVPLFLWSEDGTRMWVYCGRCEGPIFRLMCRGAGKRDGEGFG